MTSLAVLLDDALTTATELPGGHQIPDPYAVQREVVDLRLARGETIAGVKLGLTSKAKMQQMGVDSVIWGWLTDAMRIEDGGVLDLAARIHPKVEPEVAFLVRDGAVAAVAPALEVIDSRWLDFKFTLDEVIADNTSAAGFVVGSWQPLPSGLGDLEVRLLLDDEVAETGSTAAILGDPLTAFAEALRLAGTLEDDWIVLAGAATAAVRVGPGQSVRVEVAGLGAASLKASS
ncbi:4-oxalocrotonate decarboxylase [Paractinoplanes abujensis]|uniref:2-oxo-3-hexenedioate decarboxylase n=1 Tax=Paractinoplanes abujensis TaxID=882441 RepID=A0A7W7CQA6_9ACTN|nr:4-oxalocrotonate decarboxylase [Actinoplanes abujensis]MBB4692683.1 2-oxo-3-hexenedioate decarboxylase [Actinoplanes abujensis]GID22818.1 4-oxalocrotonate decarboxylase [Actinoplanes abujensis]